VFKETVACRRYYCLVKKLGEWRLVYQRIKRWSKKFFSRKNNVQSIANGDRRCIKIRLR